MKHLLSSILVSGIVLVSSGNAGTAALEIGNHVTELDVSCERLSNGMLNVRSADVAFSEKDTDGHGFFFKATGFRSTMAVIFHANGDEYKFGFSDFPFSELGFEAADQVRQNTGSKYDVDVKVEC